MSAKLFDFWMWCGEEKLIVILFGVEAPQKNIDFLQYLNSNSPNKTGINFIANCMLSERLVNYQLGYCYL